VPVFAKPLAPPTRTVPLSRLGLMLAKVALALS